MTDNDPTSFDSQLVTRARQLALELDEIRSDNGLLAQLEEWRDELTDPGCRHEAELLVVLFTVSDAALERSDRKARELAELFAQALGTDRLRAESSVAGLEGDLTPRMLEAIAPEAADDERPLVILHVLGYELADIVLGDTTALPGFRKHTRLAVRSWVLDHADALRDYFADVPEPHELPRAREWRNYVRTLDDAIDLFPTVEAITRDEDEALDLAMREATR